MSALPFIRRSDEGTVIDVYVQPRASKNELAGAHQGSLKLRLTAPPVEGEANKECAKFLAKILGVPKTDVLIVRGHKSRRKSFLIKGVTPEAMERAIVAAGYR